MSIQPMILFDEAAPWIAEVLCLPKHLTAGDIIYRPACIGQSYYIAAYCFEIESITGVAHNALGRPTKYEVHVRLDYGGRDVWTWPAWNIAHERVVGGDKIVRSNTEVGAVKRTLAGWVWNGKGM